MNNTQPVQIKGSFPLILKRIGQHLLISLLFLTGFLLTNSQAESCIPVQNDTLPMRLVTPLHTRGVKYGEPFVATLGQSYCLNNYQLPVGTELKGIVTHGHASMILGMPGYVQLALQQVEVPGQSAVSLVNNQQRSPESEKYHAPNAYTGKSILKSAIPYGVLSAACALPLRLATGIGGLGVGAICEGGRIGLGMGAQVKEPQPYTPTYGYPLHSRMGYGFLQAIGLTGTYHMLTTEPEPDLSAGATVPLKLSSTEMQSLFTAAGNPLPQPVSSPATETSSHFPTDTQPVP